MVAAETSSTDTTKKRSAASTVKRGLLITIAVIAFLLLAYRWIGTSDVRSTVQRVYEDQGEFRAELVEPGGKVLVVGNHDMYFPHFKLDSADQQARLHNLSLSQDTAEVTVWGFRLSWFSVFPNVVDVEMVQTNVERRRALANRLAGAVLEELRKKGAVQPGAGLQADTAKAIEAVLAEQETNKGAPPAPR
jgi:hypothetical protein